MWSGLALQLKGVITLPEKVSFVPGSFLPAPRMSAREPAAPARTAACKLSRLASSEGLSMWDIVSRWQKQNQVASTDQQDWIFKYVLIITGNDKSIYCDLINECVIYPPGELMSAQKEDWYSRSGFVTPGCSSLLGHKPLVRIYPENAHCTQDNAVRSKHLYKKP